MLPAIVILVLTTGRNEPPGKRGGAGGEGGAGGGDGGGGDGGERLRGPPQSVQSVPSAHDAPIELAPPSWQKPLLEKAHESSHCCGGKAGGAGGVGGGGVGVGGASGGA